MQVSKKRLNKNIKNQILNIVYQVLADTSNPQEAEILLADLLSSTELQVIAKRLAIAIFLDKGRSYENIRSTLKVSSATIASIQDMMGSPGMDLALQKVKAEQWADDWTEKITGWMNRLILAK